MNFPGEAASLEGQPQRAAQQTNAGQRDFVPKMHSPTLEQSAVGRQPLDGLFRDVNKLLSRKDLA